MVVPGITVRIDRPMEETLKDERIHVKVETGLRHNILQRPIKCL
jgi:hypothetical protein